MNTEQIANLIQSAVPQSVTDWEVRYDQLRISTTLEQLIPLMQTLQQHPELKYELLSDIAAVDRMDRRPRFDLNYILFSMHNEHRLTVTLQVGEHQEVPSLTTIWAAADFAEREVFDLMGIGFQHHPDLRRILTWDNFEGHPLRKDFPIRGETFDQAFDPDSIQVNSAFGNQELCSLDPVPGGEIENRTMILNMGPHHPATHGVLRLELELDGETILQAKPHLGYLHRGIEKLAEERNLLQIIPLTDRLDYASASVNNLGFCLTAEKLMGVDVPPRARYIRVIMAELSRIMGHQLWLGTHALDIGAMTPIFYAFADRELAMEITEEVSGYRLTPSYLRIGGVARDVTSDFVTKIRDFVRKMDTAVQGYNTLLTDNPIWTKRTRNIGVISAEKALNLGMTGPSLRGSGVAYDVRKAEPYSSYEDFAFKIPVGENGDAYDRYLVRMEEFRQSLRIIDQAIENLPGGPVKTDNPWVANPDLDAVHNEVSSLIHRFKLVHPGPKLPRGELYQAVEGAKGELGFYLVGDNDSRPYRLKMRSPCYYLVGALPALVQQHMIADVITLIGSIDIVLGEVDR